MAENITSRMTVKLAKELLRNKDAYLTKEGRKRLEQIVKKESWRIK